MIKILGTIRSQKQNWGGYKYYYIIKTPYGLCKINTDAWKRTNQHSIKTSINPTQYFKYLASEKHNNKYNYSEFDYIDSYTKSKIICPIHGVFKQTSNTHLDGSGCPSCGKIQSGFSLTLFKNRCNKNNNGVGIFYIIKCFNETEEFYKIGITSKSIKQRYSNKSRMPYKYIITQEIQDTPENIFKLENIIKKYFLKFKYEPLFKFHGSSTECFK